jgi:hypothetical protein
VNVSLDHPVTPNRVIGSPRGLRNTCRFRNLGFAREAPSPGKTCRESCDESFLGEVDFYRLSAGETADA